MEIIRLRTMTKKSVFTDGKYKGMTVAQVMQLGKMKLQYIYYNCENITFTDEVLTEICIFPERRIEKPGKDHDKFEKIMTHLRLSINDGKAFYANNWRQKQIARRRAKQAAEDEYKTKGQLQWLNQHGRY